MHIWTQNDLKSASMSMCKALISDSVHATRKIRHGIWVPLLGGLIRGRAERPGAPFFEAFRRAFGVLPRRLRRLPRLVRSDLLLQRSAGSSLGRGVSTTVLWGYGPFLELHRGDGDSDAATLGQGMCLSAAFPGGSSLAANPSALRVHKTEYLPRVL